MGRDPPEGSWTVFGGAASRYFKCTAALHLLYSSNDRSRWIIVICYDGWRSKKGWKPLIYQIEHDLFCHKCFVSEVARGCHDYRERVPNSAYSEMATLCYLQHCTAVRDLQPKTREYRPQTSPAVATTAKQRTRWVMSQKCLARPPISQPCFKYRTADYWTKNIYFFLVTSYVVKIRHCYVNIHDTVFSEVQDFLSSVLKFNFRPWARRSR